jgi:hypothetical protein
VARSTWMVRGGSVSPADTSAAVLMVAITPLP